MIGVRARTGWKVGGLVLVAGLAGLAASSEARAQTFPKDPDEGGDWVWVPLTRTDPNSNVTSPIGDVAGDAPGSRDTVGNSDYPMAYIQSDATHFYFRLRLNAAARQNAKTFKPYGWSCVIDTDGDASDYELIAIVDGVANPDSVNLSWNTVQAKPNDPADAPETLLRAYLGPLDPMQPDFGYAEEVPAGSIFPIGAPDPDFFIDWAVEWSGLLDAGVAPNTPLRIACGTSDMGAVLSADLHGPPNLPDLFGDFYQCNANGCAPQNCAGVGSPCSAGVGACANAGLIMCDATGQPVCNAVPGEPAPAEICDGLDNDCNGVADEGNPGSGADCTSGLPGICAAGKTLCSKGALACVPSIAAGEVVETCNGLDDDCNGIPDDGPAGGGEPCATGLMGACATGYTACGAGVNTCVPIAAPGELVEACNAVDDDCDGEVDEGFVLGGPCSVGIGACAAEGVVVCGAPDGVTCSATPGAPIAEVCGDDVDSDCNGAVNNDCLDSDDDGLPDYVEEEVGSDPLDPDTDDDGVRDGLEPDFGADTDGDGKVNVLDPDSDGDGLFDGTEMGFDCSGDGTDVGAGVCIPDADSGETMTDPLDVDTDDGSVSDGDEDTNKDGAVEPGERNPLDPSDDVPTTPGCTDDSSCAEGQICVDGECVDGCRGEGGPGCAEGEHCTSSGAEPGVCVPDETAGSVVTDPDIMLTGSCACATGSTEGVPVRAALAFVALGALSLRRLRRKRR